MPSDLSQLTDEQLLAFFKDALNETRPDRVRANKSDGQPRIQQMQLSPQKKAALAQLAELGVDLSFLKGKRK